MFDPRISAAEAVRLFDSIPDVVFFVKDPNGRYAYVNQTLIRRLGLHHPNEVIGRRPSELFPAPLGMSYEHQDARVLTGQSMDNYLEVHLFPSRLPGWCLTNKFPLRSVETITGLIGVSRDLRSPDLRHPAYARLSQAVQYIETRFADRVRVDTLAQLACMSVAQLERYFMYVFQLTPAQFLTKARISAAMERLNSSETIAAVGQACGYSDQSAFSRQFRRVTGLTPGQYRTLQKVAQHQQ